MGTPMIKAKKDRNYRRGLTWKRCSTCTFFHYEFGPDGNMLDSGNCDEIGTGGRGYKVLPHFLCDAHQPRHEGTAP